MADVLAANVPIKQDDPNACNAWLSTGHEIKEESVGGCDHASHVAYLAPKHQPSSLPLSFLAILTSRSIGISYPV
jgi:hypothetical protein